MDPELRKQYVEELIDNIENWELDHLIGWAQDRMEELYRKLGDQEIKALYHSIILGDDTY